MQIDSSSCYNWIIVPGQNERFMNPPTWKSSVPKPDQSTFDENLVFNIIVQNYIRAIVTEWNLDPDNSRNYYFFYLNFVLLCYFVYL